MDLEMPTPDTSPDIYREYIQRRLCWSDGAPTHASSGLQRQCPKCRTKWSYEHLALEFRLFEEYVLGRRASEAVRLVGCAKNTALGHFSQFHAAVEEIIRDRLVDGEIATHPTNLADLRSLERALRAGSRSRRRLACRHLFFRSLTLEERSEALFESTLADGARERSSRVARVASPARYPHFMPTGSPSPAVFELNAKPPAQPVSSRAMLRPALEPEWRRILEALSESLSATPPVSDSSQARTACPKN